MSPIWDTGLACHALLEVGGERAAAQVKRGLDWLVPQAGARRARRLDRAAARSAARRLGVPIRQSALSRCRRHRGRRHGDGPRAEADPAIGLSTPRSTRAREWIVGMQSENGAWGAFDADNEYYYLNNIPFADHGALLDPPTEDVTARCLSMLAQFGETPAKQHGGRARRRLSAPHAACRRQLVRPLGHELHLRHLVGAVRAQRRGRRPRRAGNAQGGRTGSSPSRTPTAAGARTARATSSTTAATSAAPSTASQTAWALLGLMAAGEIDHPAVARGIDYLARHARRRRLLERAALHRDRFPARVLSALPRLFEILPALGAGALPQSQERQHARRWRIGM